jgi:hypothetical protein
MSSKKCKVQKQASSDDEPLDGTAPGTSGGGDERSNVVYIGCAGLPG